MAPSSQWHLQSLVSPFYSTIVNPSGPVVIILATGSEVHRFKPGRGQWIFSELKNLEYGFLWKRSKAVDPVL